MTKPVKQFRFECVEKCRPGKWTSYHKAIRQMKMHGPNRKRGQGHGGSVVRRWPGAYYDRTRQLKDGTWMGYRSSFRATTPKQEPEK